MFLGFWWAGGALSGALATAPYATIIHNLLESGISNEYRLDGGDGGAGRKSLPNPAHFRGSPDFLQLAKIKYLNSNDQLAD